MLIRALGMVSLALGLTAVLPAAAAGADDPKPARQGESWRALHVLGYTTDGELETLGAQVPQLAGMGLNMLILEVNYHFQFRTYPKLRDGQETITPEGAARLSAVCRKHGIRLIPEFECVGHQSWKGDTFPLLRVYPEFDLTPDAFPQNKGLYCREWNPLNPKVNEVVFKLLDEILDGFGADALHVGMDEIFLLGSEQSPSTKGQDPAKVLARAVNDLHKHVVEERKVEMLMWGDRLIDAKKYHWDEWEAAKNGTAPAVDMIPKDIIVCPWHYELREAYPSIPMFVEKGFRVLPASWHKLDASKALIEAGRKERSPKVLGHLFTTWGRSKKGALAEYPPLVPGLKLLRAPDQ
jgi:hypothetical protein